MNQPMKPVDAHGQRFQTPDPLKIIAWLQSSEGFTIVRDEPAVVELERGTERVRISSDGLVSAIGDDSQRAAYRLLLNCEEGK